MFQDLKLLEKEIRDLMHLLDQPLHDLPLGDFEKKLERRKSLIAEIVREVSDENSSQEHIKNVVHVMEVQWHSDANRVLNQVYGAAAKNIVVDEQLWSVLLDKMITNDEESCGGAMAEAFSHPLTALFLESSVFHKNVVDHVASNLVHVYKVRFFCKSRNLVAGWIEVGRSVSPQQRNIFFEAMDKWRPTMPWKNRLGRSVGAAKRSVDALPKVAFRLLDEARRLGSQDLLSQIGMLLSFDKVVDQVHQSLQAEQPSEVIVLPRCSSVDKLRELLDG